MLYSGSASPLSELGMEQAMDNAILKLLSMLPGRYQQEAEKMSQRLYLDPSGWYENKETHPALSLLKEAVWNDVLIEMTYENWEGEQKQLIVAPYSLVYKSDRWYLVAESKSSSTMRTYRISRISDVRLQPTQFGRDSEFDITAYWRDASEQFVKRVPVCPVTLRVRPQLMVYFKSVLYGRYMILEQKEDWWVLRVEYTVFEEARSSVLGLGIDAEVIEPRTLHHAVLEQVRAIVAKYET